MSTPPGSVASLLPVPISVAHWTQEVTHHVLGDFYAHCLAYAFATSDASKEP